MRSLYFVSSEKQLTITAPANQVLTSVVTSTTTVTLPVGAGTRLTAAPRDQNGIGMSAPVTWTSSAPSVATVDANSLVQAQALGTATIVAQANANGAAASGTVAVSMVAHVPVLTSLTFTTASGATTNFQTRVGQTLQLVVTALDQFRNPMQASVSVWQSSKTAWRRSARRVSSRGLASAPCLSR